MSLIQSPAVGTTYAVPTLAQGGTQVAAAGGSVINNGTASVYIAPNAPNAAAPNQTVTIAPGGSMPWPSGVACWVWTSNNAANGAGSVYITPLQLPYDPGTLFGWAQLSAGASVLTGSTEPLLPAPEAGEAYYIFGYDISAGNSSCADVFFQITQSPSGTTLAQGLLSAPNSYPITRQQYAASAINASADNGSGEIEVEVYYQIGPAMGS